MLHIKKKEHSLVMKSEKNSARIFRLGVIADPKFNSFQNCFCLGIVIALIHKHVIDTRQSNIS